MKHFPIIGLLAFLLYACASNQAARDDRTAEDVGITLANVAKTLMLVKPF